MAALRRKVESEERVLPNVVSSCDEENLSLPDDGLGDSCESYSRNDTSPEDREIVCRARRR